MDQFSSNRPKAIPIGIDSALLKLKEQDKLRALKTTHSERIDFTSNDYLGLRTPNHKAISWGQFMGSGGSRLLGGNFPEHEKLEEYAAEWLQAESALLFNSGYEANLGVLSSLPGRDDLILYDARCHTSLKDGIRLSLAKKIPFNSLEDLKQKLKIPGRNVFIVTEALFSMDGDWCPLREIVSLKAQRENCWIILDESHSTGILGREGVGLACHLGLNAEILIRIHTFGKACGISGAVVLCPKELKEFFINQARTFIYTTAMPPFFAEAILRQLQRTRQAEAERVILSENIQFWNLLSGNNFNSPIIPWIIPDNTACKEVARSLQSKGLETRAILSPSVPLGSERIRIILHVFNSKEDIQSLYENLIRTNPD